MSQVVLSVNGLTKVFSGPFSFKTFKAQPATTAVDAISFSIREGEIVGLLGPNGAGKTTTIQLLLGTTTKTSGTIEYFGKDMDTNRSQVLEMVNYASAYTRLPWQLTVMENLLVYAKMYNVPNAKNRILKMLSEFQMSEYANKRMGSLSAGQTTRVILTKAFVNYPKIILLDEPTASLDPESAKVVRKFLLKQQRKYKVAMLFTSHNMAEVAEVCDRVVFIQHGKIIAEDTPEGLARTVTDCRLQLLIKEMSESQKRTIETMSDRVQFKKELVTLTVKEEAISRVLHALAVANIEYDQISIDKPTLEDYFIARSREKRT